MCIFVCLQSQVAIVIFQKSFFFFFFFGGGIKVSLQSEHFRNMCDLCVRQFATNVARVNVYMGGLLGLISVRALVSKSLCFETVSFTN